MCICVDANHQTFLRADSKKEVDDARAAYNAARTAFQANRKSNELKFALKLAWSKLHSAMLWAGLFAPSDPFAQETKF
jgi:hypothetical protein